MGTLVNVISADEDDLEAIGESERPVDAWSGIEARDIDRLKFISLHCLLTGESLEEAEFSYEPVYVAGGDGPIIFRIPDALTQKLASLEEPALETVGEELAASQDFDSSGVSVEEVQSLLMELADLAGIADARDQHLFVWMHPLLT